MVNNKINDYTQAIPTVDDNLLFQNTALSTGVTEKVAYSTIKWENRTLQTTNYTATIEDEVIEVDATAGNVIITLPTLASSKIGAYSKKLRITKRDATANTVTIQGNGVENINGANTLVINAQYTTEILIAGNIEWMRS